MKQVIFCDVDGTLVDRQLQDYLFYIQKHCFRNAFLYYGWLFIFVFKAPVLLIIDHFVDRRIANKLFYQNFKGIKADWYQNFIPQMIKNYLEPALNFNVIKILKSYSQESDIYLLSGNDENILKELNIGIKIKKVIGSELLVENNRLTGKIKKSCVGLSKKEIVQEIINSYQEKINIVVLTDHHSDLPILELADEKIVVNPTNKLRNIAIKNGWKII